LKRCKICKRLLENTHRNFSWKTPTRRRGACRLCMLSAQSGIPVIQYIEKNQHAAYLRLLEIKICSACGKDVPISQFRRKGKYISGACCACLSNRSRAEYAAHADKHRRQRSKYAEAHRVELAGKARAFRREHPDKIREYYARYKKKHPEKLVHRSREQYAKDVQANREYARRYRQEHPDAVRITMARCQRNRRASRPEYIVKDRAANVMRRALSGTVKRGRTLELVGCSAAAFREHIERQFLPGMTWENKSMWHIDHIVPVSAFDLSSEAAQRACFHYTNTKPMWKADNIKKGDKISEEWGNLERARALGIVS
jgi:hypothetical protein